MKDFYSRKLDAFKQCDELLKKITQSGGKAKHLELLRELDRITGFNRVIERHIQDLMLTGEIGQSYDEKGESLLEWVGQ